MPRKRSYAAATKAGTAADEKDSSSTSPPSKTVDVPQKVSVETSTVGTQTGLTSLTVRPYLRSLASRSTSTSTQTDEQKYVAHLICERDGAVYSARLDAADVLHLHRRVGADRIRRTELAPDSADRT